MLLKCINLYSKAEETLTDWQLCTSSLSFSPPGLTTSETTGPKYQILFLKNVLSSGPEGISNSLSISISCTFGNLWQVSCKQFWNAAPSQAAPADPKACSCLIISAVCHFPDKCMRHRGNDETMTADKRFREQWQVLVWPANANRELSLHCLLIEWKYCHQSLIYSCDMEISL